MSLRQPVVRFLGTGLLNTVFGYLVYALLIIVGCPAWLAAGGSVLLGILFNFFSYGRLVFGPVGVGRLPAFIAVYAVLYGLNVALLHLLMSHGAGALVAQSIALPVLAVLGYILMRVFVFTSHLKSVADSAGPRRP